MARQRVSAALAALKAVRPPSDTADVHPVRRPLPPLAALAILVALSAAAPPAGASERAWATVNVCDPPAQPAAVGVRAFVPAGLGVQWIRVRAEWFDAGTKTWKDVNGPAGDGGWQRLGDGRSGVRGGTTFRFRPPAAGRVLVGRGRVQVQYRRGPKVLRRLTLRTSSGRPVAAGDLSLAQCFVRR
jgi:hypothetical protein